MKFPTSGDSSLDSLLPLYYLFFLNIFLFYILPTALSITLYMLTLRVIKERERALTRWRGGVTRARRILNSHQLVVEWRRNIQESGGGVTARLNAPSRGCNFGIGGGCVLDERVRKLISTRKVGRILNSFIYSVCSRLVLRRNNASMRVSSRNI